MEKERIQYLIELHKAFKSNDIVEQLDNFKMLTSSLFKLANSLFDKNEKIKYYHSELENKYFRFGLANHSISNLMNGNNFKLISLDVNITDLFSVFSITRMQIESYSLMFYLFFDEITEDEKNFRYDIYKLHGLLKQSEFSVISEQGVNKKNKILEEINLLKEKVIKSEIYRKSSDKEQKEYLKPKRAMFLYSKELLKKSGLESSRIDEMWNLYSNHAHGEHISDRQFNTIYKINKSTLDETLLALNINSILTSKLCIFLCNSFEGVQQTYEHLDIKEKVHIEIWSKLYDKRI
ncbi:hypothetical protein [Flavobacterium sp.]|uniref:hypothetical protein n=1 Tax=Flavobacterium sp. TaxID=239 RepID=UPI004047CD7E